MVSCLPTKRENSTEDLLDTSKNTPISALLVEVGSSFLHTVNVRLVATVYPSEVNFLVTGTKGLKLIGK